MAEELQKFGQWTLMPEGWEPEAKESEEPKQDVQKFGQWTLMPEGWEPELVATPMQKEPTQETSYLDYLKDIPNVAANLAKGAASIPISLGKFIHSYLPSPGLPPEHPALRGMTPEQIAESEQVGRRGVQESVEKGLEEIVPKAKTELGREASEAADTLGAILFPIPGLGAAPLKHALGISGAGQLAKWGAKKIGFGDDEAESFKLGSMLLTSLFGNARPIKQAREIYGSLRESLPPSVTVPTAPLQSIIREVEREFSPHVLKDVGGTKMLNTVLGNLEELAQGSKIPVREIIDFKQRLPDAISEVGRYGKKAEVPFIDLQKRITNYLRTSQDLSTPVKEGLKTADELYTGYRNMTKAASFMKNAIKKVKDSVGQTTLGLFGYHLPAKVPVAVGTAIGTLGYTGLASIWELFKNPSIRNHYAKAVAYAARDTKGKFLKEVRALDNKINQLENLKK